jgi:hypothetical protein
MQAYLLSIAVVQLLVHRPIEVSAGTQLWDASLCSVIAAVSASRASTPEELLITVSG